MKQYRSAFLVVILALLLISISGGTTSAATADLLISEYIEGSSFNKAIEIYNGTGAAVDLAAGNYELELYSNGSASASQSVALSGTVADGDVFVLAHGSANSAILAEADVTNSSVINFNGDDAVVLRKAGAVVDAFGQIGVDPGSEWPGGGQNDTLRRQVDVCAGDTDASDPFDASLEWNTFAEDTFDGLGSHTADCDDISPLLPRLNEFSASTTGVDVEYVEIFGAADTDYSAYSILEIEGDGDNAGIVDGVIGVGTTDATGFWLENLPANALENGSVTLLLVENFAGTQGDDLDTDNDGVLDLTPWDAMVDAVAVDDGNSGDWLYGIPALGPNYDGISSFPPGGASRIPDGLDTDSASDWVRNDFDLAGIPGFPGTPEPGEALNTPGAPNALVSVEPTTDVIINEVDADTAGTDTLEFVELYDGGAGNTALDGLVVVFYNGSDDASYAAYDLDGFSTDASGYFLLGNPDVAPTPAITFGSNGVQNGADAVALHADDAASFPNDTPVTTDNLIDAIVYDTNDGDDAGLLPLLNGGQPQVNEDGAGDKDNHSNQRCPNGSGGARNTESYAQFTPTPGSANTCGATAAEVYVNEVRIGLTGFPDADFFEIQGAPGASLDGLTYVVISGEFEPGQIDFAIDLSGASIPADGFFVAAGSDAASAYGITPDLSVEFDFFGSPTTHLIVDNFTGNSGDDLDTNNDGALDVTPWSAVSDAVSFIDGDDNQDFSYGGAVVGPDGSFTPAGTYRCGDAPTGTFDNNQLDFGSLNGTPGESNAPLCAPPVVEAKIHEVQGDGDSVAITDPVLVEAIVVGDFRGEDQLDGFFIQEEDGDADTDPNTSEGIFVYCGACATDVAEGDLVQVTGQPEEFFDMSQIDVTGTGGAVSIVSSGNALPALTEITLPVASIGEFEKYEGMYVTFPQELFISEFFNFDRFGEIVLTTERQFQPTATFDPGSTEAAQLAAENALSRITLDDGRTNQNPDPAIHPNGMEFTLDNRFRGGDIVENATGVLNYSFGLYRLQPTEGAEYTAVNGRPTSPEDVGGNLKVAAFNVLNYFNTIDDGVNDICGPLQNQECRGADNEEERIRQLDKIVSAMVDMEADVLGIIEVENTAGVEAMADIVDGLNAVFGPDTYAYVDTGTIGSDPIKVGFIYKTTTVTLVGDYAVLDTPEFVDPNNTGEDRNRPALAQTFIDSETGGVFTVVVNHLKSKGTPCGPGDDDPEAASCNVTRTLAAQELADWLATDPTNSGDGDFLIVGDLNSYDKEDPIDVLIANGYADLIAGYQGEFAYSYVFDGQLGYLDYGMANSDMAEEVTGVTVWHINSDEPDIIDYDTTFKQDAQDALYEPNAYRSSDHDPVIVGLNVCDEIAPTLSVTMTPDMLWPPNHQYVTVSPIIDVADNFDTDVTVTLLSVTSDEPDNGLGDGDMPNDIVINDDGTVDLRAERSGTGDGRVYTFTYEAVDDCGNSTIATATVTVPFSQGG